MKTYLILVTALLFNSIVYSQTNVGNENILYLNNSKVGINKSNPSWMFELETAATNGQNLFVITNTGVGNASGLVLRSTSTGNNSIAFRDNNTVTGAILYNPLEQYMGIANYNYSTLDASLKLLSNGSMIFCDPQNSSTNRFLVTKDGKLFSNEISVQSTIADYVFDEAYKLMPLDSLETYINQYKHLPNIQNQKEVDNNNGFVNIGQLNISLLEKVEELTLHILELNKRLKKLESVNEKQINN